MLCPCHSGKLYKECCQPFHQGLAPKNALQLMRSRYAAYALNLPNYIIKTTHPLNPQYCKNHAQWAKKNTAFSLSSRFENLEILDFEEHENYATVTFIAHLSQGKQDATFTEKSLFEKINGYWLYRDGQRQ